MSLSSAFRLTYPHLHLYRLIAQLGFKHRGESHIFITIGPMIIAKHPSKMSVTPVVWIPMSSKIAPVRQIAIPDIIILSVDFILIAPVAQLRSFQGEVIQSFTESLRRFLFIFTNAGRAADFTVDDNFPRLAHRLYFCGFIFSAPALAAL